MKKLLLTNRERDVIRTILELLTSGVVLSATFVAPGISGPVGKLYLGLRKIPDSTKRQALAEMKRRELVEVKQGTRLVLTEKGRRRLQRYKLEELRIARPRIWDGLWHIVFFDIPRKPRSLNTARDHLRERLKQLGFTPIQKSVWLHPFPCEDEIAYITEVYGLQPYVKIALARSVTGEKTLRTLFNL